MKPPLFEYEAPETLDEALRLLAEHADEAKVLAGGQSLVPLLNFRLAKPGLLVDINRVRALDYVRRSDGWLEIGAIARQRAVELDPTATQACPLLTEALSYVGHFQIRNRGTVVGSLAHADPAAELPAVAFALGAELDVCGQRGRRSVPASEFFLGYLTTALQADELLVAVRFPARAPRTGYAFTEFARRHGDFALVGVAAVVELDEAGSRCTSLRLAYTGVGPRPVLFEDPQGILRGQVPDPRVISVVAQRAASLLEPDSDLHASGEYRRDLAGVLAERALQMALSRGRGK